MKTRIVFLFTLLALAPIIHGRHTSLNRYNKLDEPKLMESEELEELEDPGEFEDPEEFEYPEEFEDPEGPPPEESEESSAEEPSEGGVCSVEAEDRNDCGWVGIDEATCEGRGCCYDETVSDVAWCFYPTDNKCYGIDPEEREDCGYIGIQRDECENEKGCCFDHTVPNVAWCFKGSEPQIEREMESDTPGDTCDVEAEDRNDCGWFGIDEATCEARGCCYDDTTPNTKWCFYPTDNKCYGIEPKKREDCGYIGIQREECEDERGCCFDHTVQDVAWCFKGTGPVTVAPPEVETQEGSAEASGA